MGILGDFIAGFAPALGQQILDRRQQEAARREEVRREQAEERRWARRRRAEIEDIVARTNATATPQSRRVQGPAGEFIEQDLIPQTRVGKGGNIERADPIVAGSRRYEPRSTGKTKEVKEGNDIVTYELYDDGSRREIARAPRAMGRASSAAPRNQEGMTPFEQARVDRMRAKDAADAEKAKRSEFSAIDKKIDKDLEDFSEAARRAHRNTDSWETFTASRQMPKEIDPERAVELERQYRRRQEYVRLARRELGSEVPEEDIVEYLKEKGYL